MLGFGFESRRFTHGSSVSSEQSDCSQTLNSYRGPSNVQLPQFPSFSRYFYVLKLLQERVWTPHLHNHPENDSDDTPDVVVH